MRGGNEKYCLHAIKRAYANPRASGELSSVLYKQLLMMLLVTFLVIRCLQRITKHEHVACYFGTMRAMVLVYSGAWCLEAMRACYVARV